MLDIPVGGKTCRLETRLGIPEVTQLPIGQDYGVQLAVQSRLARSENEFIRCQIKVVLAGGNADVFYGIFGFEVHR
ncbi:hypothetical protein D3C76_1232110 [compost metagenome]